MKKLISVLFFCVILLILLYNYKMSEFDIESDDIVLALYSIETSENSYRFILKPNGVLIAQKGTFQDVHITDKGFIQECQDYKKTKLSSDITSYFYTLANEVCTKDTGIQHENVELTANDAHLIKFEYKDVAIKQVYHRTYSSKEKEQLMSLIGFVPFHTSGELKTLVEAFVDISPIEIGYPFN